jgi:ABC-type multidrug transport system ATPase subunit
VSFDFTRVEVADVSRHFGRRRAVTRVSLATDAGDILGLLGPNGAGKSTLIGMLATLMQPTTGTIRYGDRFASDAGPGIRGRIGLLAHELHLYPELSAAQNLSFFAELYGLDARTAVGPALERAGLTDRVDDSVSSFSRGMRQRLALERALLHRPRLVLLDEPFTGLDDSAVTTVSNRLKQLAAEGAIIILATHDLDLADGLVNRFAVMQNGRLVVEEAAGPSVRARYRALVAPTAPARVAPEAESLRSRPRDGEAAASSGRGAPERESLRSSARGSEAAPASGGGAPRENK